MTVLMDPAPPIVGDTFRIITFTAGGRPTTVLDLNDGTGYYRNREAGITYTPGVPTTQYSKTARRYGGSRAVGETHDNGGIAWTAYIKGTTDTDARDRVEALLAQIHETARDRYLQWGPVGGQSSYLQIAGPGTWVPTYNVREFGEQHALSIQIAFPVLPLVEWDRMRISDDFSIDTIADYTFDAMTATDVTVTGGKLTPAGTLTTLRRARHTARGYTTLEGQQTVTGAPGATITSYRLGVQLRASATAGVDIYVDDNGTNSRLRVDVNTGSGWVNRASTNLAARVSNGTALWVRGRIEGNVVTAEHFTSTPTPMGTPTTTTSYTLAGAEITIPAGNAGWTWTPQHASATVDDLEFLPYVRRNQTLPQVVQWADAIPGTAPALTDMTITPSGGTAAPVAALIGWSPRATTPVAGAVVPFGILEAETAGDLTGWNAAASVGARGGSRLEDSTVSGAETYTASWTIDPSTLDADDFTNGELALELWARVRTDSTLVSPRLTASVRPVDGLNFGAERFTLEWGSAGKLVPVPTAGAYRFMRLGTLLVASDPLRPRSMKLWLAGATSTGSTGVFGIDYLVPLLARSRALSPTGEPLDATYPKFVSSTSETSKTIRTDLSGLVAAPPANPYADHGLGGNLLELPTGPVDVLAKLSSLVPDDPTVDATSEQMSHSATISVCPVPRSFLLRND